jgi:putative NADPH-quinone reductase
VWSNGWAYAWEHDPEGSLLRPRACVMLVPTGASRALMDRFGYDKEIDHLWRYGVLGYCGVTPIRIELMLGAAFDTGIHDAHHETAYRAGRDIAEIGTTP